MTIQAGDALWRLYGGIAMIERLCPSNAQVSFLTSELHKCAAIIGAHISVPEPTTVDFGKIIASLRNELPADSTPAAMPRSQSERPSFSDPEIVEAAGAFTDMMVSSQLFEWASMVEDIYQRLQAGGAFVTFKQARALINIANRGEFEDGSSFMDRAEDEIPEAVKLVKDWAAQA